MNADTILARIEQLKAEREQIMHNIAQLQANVNAYDGALQDCEYWLEQLKKEQE